MPLDPDYVLFTAIVEAGSLSAAARHLRISPAMVSKRLARLEERLATRLVHRTTRKLALTAAGAMFHQDVLAILCAVREAEERLTGTAREPGGPLRVSAPTSFGRLHIAPGLHTFLNRHPRVKLELDLSDSYVDLMSERTDLAIRITADVPAGVEAHRLARSPRYLTAAPCYLAARGAPERLSDLRDHHLLAADGQLPWRLVSRRGRQQVDGHSHVRTNSSEIVRELALSGIGIALRSLWDVSQDLSAGRLVRVLPEWEGQRELGIYAMHLQATRRSAALDAFVAFLRTSFDPPPWEEVVPDRMKPLAATASANFL